MTRWADTMGVEDPQAMAMAASSPRSRSTGSASRRSDGPTAAVGVVAGGSDQDVAVGQAHGRAVADDGRGIAFNAQAVTVATRIAVAEASWRDLSTGDGVSVAGRDAGPPSAADGGRAGRRGGRRSGAGGSRGTRPRRAGRQGCRPSGGGRAAGPGRAGGGAAGSSCTGSRRYHAPSGIRRMGSPSSEMGRAALSPALRRKTS